MTEKQTTTSGKIVYFVMAGSVLSLILRVLPFMFPDGRMWGFNHLLFVSEIGQAIFVLLAILALLALFNPFRRILSNLFDATARYLFDESNNLKWLVIGVAAVPVFWLFRMPTSFLGDGYTLINNLGNDLPVIFKWSETGSIRAVYYISRLLPLEGLARGEIGYAVVSVLSGGVTLFFFAKISFELTDDSAGRMFSFLLLIFSGWMLLFFGYAENYPILWPCITGYIYFSLRYISGRSLLYWPALYLAIALFLHLQVLFFSISFLSLLFVRGIGRRFFKKYRFLVLGLFAVGIGVGITIFYLKYQSSIAFQIHWLPPFTGRPVAPDYAIFSLPHFIDILNEFALLIPLVIIFVIAAVGQRWKLLEDAVDSFLILFSIGGLVLLFVLDPRIGMGRDWDLFALCGLAPILIFLKKWTHTGMTKRYYPSLAILALALCLPFFITNLTYSGSVDYATSLLELDQSKSRSGMSVMRDYYHNQGEVGRADSINAEIVKLFPRAEIMKQAFAMAKSGQMKEANRIADSLYKIDPFSKEAINLRGSLAIQAGNYKRAIEVFGLATELSPYDPAPKISIAIAHQRVGRYFEMLNYLREAQKLNPDFVKMLECFSLGFYQMKQYDSAHHYGRRIIELDPNNPNGYLASGTACFQLHKARLCEKYLKKYLQMVPNSADKMEALNMYDQAVKYLNRSQGSP